jgi:tetratricopeptide (TPR) repeat protein
MKHVLLLIGLLVVGTIRPLTAQTSQSYIDGIKAIDAKDYTTAKTLLLKALDESANKEETWYALGFVGQYTADFRLMIEAGKKVAELNPQRRDGWYFMATGYFQSGVMDSVAMPARKLIEIDREIAERSNLIKILEILGQDDKGRRDSVFSTPDAAISITLPASWSTKHVDDDKVKQWFISLEPVVADTDLFSTGATIRWVRRLGTTFPAMKGVDDMKALLTFWRGFEAGQMGGMKIFRREQIDSVAFRIGDWAGELLTIKMQLFENSYELTKFDIALARKDEILTIVLECPSQYWPVYRKRFEQALKSMRTP